MVLAEILGGCSSEIPTSRQGEVSGWGRFLGFEKVGYCGGFVAMSRVKKVAGFR
jgi:hypothetical protein